VNPDGSGLRRLTDDGVSGTASWSPDGTGIVFSRATTPNSAKSLHADIYVMRADGSGARALTDDPADDGSPAWQPVAGG
jgi:Tol biopolymer transport system component